ncbi:CDP-alcohol phosphatidyltransferase family protein [Natranaeroarchaeum aerophilus]|uniref:CDP-alcohol phosphatidyltransferase family protein n=1 Tax=Natranaeroarchaeum aerophilus TaxID=2917711 RepID=A0AAE3FRL3_9EURY|nr:CDP-alcohol phosphatidyltransferase family protein [Natranaeroarchaeum aerophilus]MCL9813901.1 CDP-alcohol phosphatidyltransferase family protein [Natranaeroarchaeum aerophilus]
MTLDQFRSVADRALEPFVALSTRLGLSPDAISVLAFLAAVAAGGAYYVAGETAILYLVGAVLVGLNGALDLLDGAVAREQNVDSKAGDLLDHVLDRYADIVIIAGLAAGIGSYVLGFAAVTGVLMTSYLGTQAQAVGLDRDYGGMLGRADRLAIIGIVTGIAAFVQPTVAGFGPIGWLLVLFAVVGHVTALQRFWGAWNDLD